MADEPGKDMVILPSSVHEVLLIPYDEETVPEEMDRVGYLSDAKPVQAGKEEKDDNKRFP